jgi:hypothetical protein
LGAPITVRASGLIAGDYSLYLGKTVKHPAGGQAVSCLATIGRSVHSHGSAKFTGRLPRRLVCRTGAGPPLGTIPVTAGRYQLLVASPSGPGSFSGSRSFVKRAVRVS